MRIVKYSLILLLTVFCHTFLYAENYELSDTQPVISEAQESTSGSYTLEVSDQAPVFVLPVSLEDDGTVIIPPTGNIPIAPPIDEGGGEKAPEDITLPAEPEIPAPPTKEKEPVEEKKKDEQEEEEEEKVEEEIAEEVKEEPVDQKEIIPKEIQPVIEPGAGEEPTGASYELAPSPSGQITLVSRQTKSKTTVSNIEGMVDVIDLSGIQISAFDMQKTKCVFAVITEISEPYKIVKIRVKDSYSLASVSTKILSSNLEKLKDWKFIHVMALHNLRTDLKTEYDIVALSTTISEREIFSDGKTSLLSEAFRNSLKLEADSLNQSINDKNKIILSKFRTDNIKQSIPNKFLNLFNKEAPVESKTPQPTKKYSIIIFLFTALIVIAAIVIFLLKFRKK